MDSYSCTYVEAERQLLGSGMSFTALAILRYLCSRADPVGRCWPSQDTIAEDLNLRRETVNRHLADLEQADLVRYLRRAGTDPVTGQRTTNVYIVTPDYYAVRPELQAQAVALWNGNFQGAHVIVRSHQPPTATTVRNQQQKPPPGTSSSNQNRPGKEEKPGHETAENLEADGHDDKLETPQQAQRAQQSADSPHATKTRTSKQQVTSKTRFSAAGRIAYPQIKSASEPFEDAAIERLAVRCRDEAQVPLPTARGLVNHYGPGMVESVLNSGTLTKADKPGGLLRYILHAQVSNPDDLGGRSNGNRYTAGEYAEWVES